MRDNTIVRPVAEADCRAITGIYNHYIADTTATFEVDTVSEREMADRIKSVSARFPYLVIEEEGRVVGYSYVHTWKDRAAYSHTLELTIYLDCSCRGRGLGSKLLGEIIRKCHTLDTCHTLVACITEDNKESIAFHSRHGFQQVSLFREVGRKFGRWLDVVDMQLMV